MIAITVTQTTEGVKCTELIVLIYMASEDTSLLSINILVQFGVKKNNNDVDDDVDVTFIYCSAPSSISKMFVL